MKALKTQTRTGRRPLPALIVALALMTAGAAWGAEHRQTISRELDAAADLVVELENLAGAVTITGGGSRVGIKAAVTARADSDAEARRLASELTVDFEQRGDRLIVKAKYPVERYDTYHYPGGGSGSEASGLSRFFGGGSRTGTRYQGTRVTVVSSPRSGAVTLFADFAITLPAGVGADVENAAGDVTASGVAGPLSLDTGSGSVRASGGEGRVEADTGSGDVEVSDHRGDVAADTGSGDVRLTRIVGNVEADTGSGGIELEDVEGVRIDADTGSGEVRLTRVRGEITADTGSGGVEGRDLVAGGRLEVDTGSGDVDLQGDFSAVDGITIDAGSGDVTLEGSSFPPMDLEISTGSSGIEVDLPGLEILEKDKDYLEARYNGGGARVSIDTGSGRVRVR